MVIMRVSSLFFLGGFVEKADMFIKKDMLIAHLDVESLYYYAAHKKWYAH